MPALLALVNDDQDDTSHLLGGLRRCWPNGRRARWWDVCRPGLAGLWGAQGLFPPGTRAAHWARSTAPNGPTPGRRPPPQEAAAEQVADQMAAASVDVPASKPAKEKKPKADKPAKQQQGGRAQHGAPPKLAPAPALAAWRGHARRCASQRSQTRCMQPAAPRIGGPGAPPWRLSELRPDSRRRRRQRRWRQGQKEGDAAGPVRHKGG